MEREKIIWAAGLFEGEGWISIQGKTPSMGIQMCDKDILEKFQAAIGLGNIHYRKPRVYSYEKINSRKEQWAWRVSGFEKVQALSAYLWQWLGLRRRTRIHEVLDIAKTGQLKPGMPLGAQISTAKHGTVKKYWTGCKCEPCLLANRLYNHQRKINAKIYKS